MSLFLALAIQFVYLAIKNRFRNDVNKLFLNSKYLKFSHDIEAFSIFELDKGNSN